MRRLKALLLMTVMAVMLLGSTINVFALSATELQAFIDDYGAEKAKKIIGSSNIQPTQSDASWVQVDLGGVLVYITSDGVTNVEAELERIATKASAADKSNQHVNDVMNDIGNIDLTPDVDSALISIDGFLPGIRMVLGIIVTLITVGMTILCACDISYIVFPVFRNKCEDMKQSGKGVDHKRSERTGQTKLRFISDEAEYAINAAETIQTGKNPLVIYFGKRALSYIVLTIVIFILLTGNITVITDIALKAVQGILDIIQSAAA